MFSSNAHEIIPNVFMIMNDNALVVYQNSCVYTL